MRNRQKVSVALAVILIITSTLGQSNVLAINPERHPRRILPHRIEGHSMNSSQYGDEVNAKYLGKDYSVIVNNFEKSKKINDVYLIDEKVYVGVDGVSKLLTDIGRHVNIVWNKERNLLEVAKGVEYEGEYSNELEKKTSKKAKEVVSSDKILVRKEGYKKAEIYEIDEKKYMEIDELGNILGFEADFREKAGEILLKLEEEIMEKPLERILVTEENIDEYREKLNVKVYFPDEYIDFIKKHENDTNLKKRKELTGNGNVGKKAVKVNKLEIIRILYEIEEMFPLENLTIYFNPYEQPDYKYYSGYYHEYTDSSNPNKIVSKSRIDIFTTVRQDITGTLLHEIGHKIYFDKVYYRELEDEYMNIYPESLEVDEYDLFWDEDISEGFAEDIKLYLAEKLQLKGGEKGIKKTVYNDKRKEARPIIESAIKAYKS